MSWSDIHVAINKILTRKTSGGHQAKRRKEGKTYKPDIHVLINP
jgi:hypothetical protein